MVFLDWFEQEIIPLLEQENNQKDEEKEDTKEVSHT